MNEAVGGVDHGRAVRRVQDPSRAGGRDVEAASGAVEVTVGPERLEHLVLSICEDRIVAVDHSG